MADSPDLDTEGVRSINMAAGRRALLQAAGLGAVTAALVGNAKAQSTPNLDVAILNFALNLEYLEAEYYLRATYDDELRSSESQGIGTVGKLIGGRQVPFANPIVRDFAYEITANERNHVNFLRATLGSQAIARPTIDISVNTFSTAARAAGLVGPNGAFDPYADDVSFLLGAYMFEDVGVTAYNGAAPFITNKAYLAAAAGILAVEAYQGGAIRTLLFAQQSAFATKATALISALRASLSGKNDDQGIGAQQSTLAGGPRTPSNIVPADANSLAFARTPRQVTNIVVGAQGASAGLFFPNGPNGDLATLFSL